MKFAIGLSFFVAVAAFVSGTHSNEADYYCGRRLAQALATFCYNPMSIMVKRSQQHNGLVRQDGLQFPWLRASHARALTRGKRGITEECCSKPCDYDELLTYC